MVCDSESGVLASVVSHQAIHVAFSISRALIYRQYAVEQLLNTLIGLLSDEVFGTEAARGFSTLFSPHSLLSKDWGANIRLLVKQRVLVYCIPIMGQRIRNSKGAVKFNHLTALCAILRQADLQLVMPQMDSLLPMLLQSLDLDDKEARAASLDIFMVVAKESSSLLEEHITGLLSRLLKASSNHKGPDLASPPSNISIVTCKLTPSAGRTRQGSPLPVYPTRSHKAHCSSPAYENSR